MLAGDLCGNRSTEVTSPDTCIGAASAGVPYPSPLSNFFGENFHAPYPGDGGFGSSSTYPSPLSNSFS
ncbi:MAG: hypothetical protein WA667_23135 [Candidatus Nitrosopolaris sp.]